MRHGEGATGPVDVPLPPAAVRQWERHVETFNSRQTELMVYDQTMCKLISRPLLLVLLVGCASTPAPGPTPRETAPEPTLVEIVRDRQDIAVSHTDTRLAIDNPHGNVYLRQSAEPYIGVFSTEQRLASQPAASFMQRIEDWFLAYLPIENEM